MSLHSDGRNSLQSTNPEIAQDFDLQNNDGLTAHDVVAGTSVKIHWKCSSCNYQWIASGAHRITKGRNCRACANQAVKPDLSNSLGTVFPDLRMQFDVEKNPTKSVDDYTSGSTSMICTGCLRAFLENKHRKSNK